MLKCFESLYIVLIKYSIIIPYNLNRLFFKYFWNTYDFIDKYRIKIRLKLKPY